MLRETKHWKYSESNIKNFDSIDTSKIGNNLQQLVTNLNLGERERNIH